ncbi:MAG: flavodoxin family protein [Methanoregula sp.]|nr:flavodoxin family protein [Methanoregula sp.]
MGQILHRDVNTIDGIYTLTVGKEDLSRFYPGMIRYTLSASSGTRALAIFRTNTYEYSPTVSFDAEMIAMDRAGEWEQQLMAAPREFLTAHASRKETVPFTPVADVVILQGSPRADGNCSILAGWVADAAWKIHKKAQVIYPHDLNIKSCIGCYQCYNTGTCTFDDDMRDIINSIRYASLLVVCSPVYTNSVPGGLKLVIDRCQAYHAELTMTGDSAGHKKGLIVSVAGRTGSSHFLCVKKVVNAFLRNIGVNPAGEFLIDNLDELRDVRSITGLREKITIAVQRSLTGQTTLSDNSQELRK